MKKILIVDDEKDLLNMTAISLKRWGYEPLRAGSGKEGIDMLAKETPDLAIIDIRMPDINGYDICKKIKEKDKLNKMPVIISTASGTLDMKKLLDETGAEDIIIKPYDNEDLKKKIKKLLKK